MSYLESTNPGIYRNEGQQLSDTSTTIDALSIVDSYNTMDQLPTSTHTHGSLQKKGKLVTFYRNGDPNFKGIAIPISQKWFLTLETLIDFLNEKISTPTGIRYIFKIPDGVEMKDVNCFQPGEAYVVSSVKNVIYGIQYGRSMEQYWINKPPSAGKLRKNDHYLFMKNYEEINSKRSSQHDDNSRSVSTIRSTTKMKKTTVREILIVSNTDRKSSYMIVVNNENRIKFEDLLYDVSEMLNLANPPVQTLYTSSKPFKRICSYGQLFKEFLHEERFIACGSEFYPLEMKKPPKPKQLEKPFVSLSQSKEYVVKNFVNSFNTKSTQTSEDKIRHSFSSPNIKADSSRPTPLLNSPKPQSSPQTIVIDGVERNVYPSKQPTSMPKLSANNNQILKINWIYGFDSRLTDNCMVVIHPDELVYCVGKIAIIFNATQNQQRYFTEHTSLITCFAIHPNRRYAASGQSGDNGKSMVLLWTIYDCCILSKIHHDLLENLFSLDFSNDGGEEYLMVLDSSQKGNNQNLNIFNWTSGKRVAYTKCNREEVLAGRFHPEDSSTIITYGFEHINVWRVFWQDPINGRILRDKKSGIFEFCVPEYVSCLIFDLTGNILTGDSNGSIHLWSLDEEEAFVNRTVPQLFHAHKDNVSSILLVGDGTVISASNNSIKAWDSFNDFKFVKERQISECFGRIKSIVSCHPETNDGKLWIATERSIVLEGTLQDSFTVLFQNHGLSGCPVKLAASPNNHCFVSGGSDKLLMKWSMLQRRVIWTSPLDNECTAIAFHVDGHYIAVGTATGKLVIVQNKTGSHVMSLQVDQSQKPISCLQYSPDGRLLCVGCSKSGMKMFSVLDLGAFYRLVTSMEFKDSWNVLRVDWSSDSKAIRTEDNDFNIRIWSLHPMVKEKESMEPNQIDFITESCLVTSNYLSLWEAVDPDKLSVAQKSMKRDQVVYGTSSGLIGLAQFPLQNPMDIKSASLNLGRVGGIAISFDDNFVLSSNHDMNCSNIFQWAITDG